MIVFRFSARIFLIPLLLMASPSHARADGGTLRFSQVRGPYRVTLFTAPVSPRAGVVDFSVMLQEAGSDRPRFDIPVSVHAWPTGRPESRRGGRVSSESATNKLFRDIPIDLPDAGEWTVSVVVGNATPIEAIVVVAPPPPAWLDLVGWITWPAGAVMIFFIHRAIVKRKRRSPVRDAR